MRVLIRIIFRALQGLGGAGNYAISTIIILEMVPPQQFAKYTGIVATVFVFSFLFGPLFGGAITQNSTWRWIFLLNIPPGAIAVVSLMFTLPNGFPHHHKQREIIESFSQSFSQAFKRIDILGAFLLLAATLLLVVGLDEADEQFSWQSAFTIAVLTIAGVLWILFAIWERWVTMKAVNMEPVFPWRFFQNRVWISMLLHGVLLGMTMFVTMFILPQRFEIVNELSPFHAAVRFIPFTIFSPVASIISSVIAKSTRIPLMYLLIVGALFQILAYSLLGTLPQHHDVSARQYGYEILAGFGCGINIPLLTLMTPFATEKRDHGKFDGFRLVHERQTLNHISGAAMGAIAQFRIMGGAIGLAIATAIQHSYLRSHLSDCLTSGVIETILQSTSAIATLPTDSQTLVRATYAASYNMQMKFLAGMAGAQVITGITMWKRDPIIAPSA
ncbi:MFS general substrate transporter [Penicillium malachiteum]|uniref:MFS general substrate transporter n=1 Tax=Penicillium malachiteum TaxID=1324776 RepID=A0AAD6HHJ3_9EURO|nr:MFS general substrate transporter [Penicillium malachiteum]